MSENRPKRLHEEEQATSVRGIVTGETNLYAVLGVDSHADSDAVADAYLNLRERYHPENNPRDPMATEIVRYLDAAYAALIDPERRKAYDANLGNGTPSNGVRTEHTNGATNSNRQGAPVTEPSDSAPPRTATNGRNSAGSAETTAPTLTVEDLLQAPAGGGRGRGGGRRRNAYADRNLTEGSIPKNLWFLAWPQMVEGVMRVVDQMADLVWAGHGLGTRAIAGLGVSQQYTQMAFTARQGIDTAMRAMVARAVGAGNIPLANHIVLQAGTITAGFAILMMIIGVVFTEFLLQILGVSNEVIAQGAMYMRVQFIGQGVTGFQMLSGHALSASGDTLTPMKANVVSRILHLVLSPVLIFGWIGLPALGLPGAAWANIIAHAVSLVMILMALFRGSSRLHLTLEGYQLDWPIIKQLLKIGAPASVNSIERSLAQLLMVWLVAPFGDFALAAFTLTRRVEMFANLGSQGLGQASGIIVGQSLGAGKPDRARQTVMWATGYVVVAKSILGSIMFAFPVLFLSIFSTDAELLAVAKIWLQIQVLGYIAMGIGQVALQSFQTAGDTLVPMFVTLFSMYAVEVPLAIALTQWTDLGQFGVAWAIVAAMLVRPLIYIPYFFWGRWLRIGVLNAQTGRLGMRRGGGGH